MNNQKENKASMRNCTDCETLNFDAKFKVYSSEIPLKLKINIMQSEKKAFSLDFKIDENPTSFVIENLKGNKCFCEFVFLNKNQTVEKLYSIVFPKDDMHVLYPISGVWTVNDDFKGIYINEIKFEPLNTPSLHRTHNATIYTNNGNFKISVFYSLLSNLSLLHTNFDKNDSDTNGVNIGIPADFVIMSDNYYFNFTGNEFFNNAIEKFKIDNHSMQLPIIQVSPNISMDSKIFSINKAINDIKNNKLRVNRSYERFIDGGYMIRDLEAIFFLPVCMHRFSAFCSSYESVKVDRVMFREVFIKFVNATRKI